jgi:hypothetical protein
MSRYFSLMLCAPAVVLMACSFESKPDDAFLDSSMILRPGVDDAHTTVRQYVDMLASRSQTDGTPVKITRWEHTKAGYTLYLQSNVPVEMPFTWSPQEKAGTTPICRGRGQPHTSPAVLHALTEYAGSSQQGSQNARTAVAGISINFCSSATPASTVGTATPEAPSASQAEMDAESEGVPSDPALLLHQLQYRRPSRKPRCTSSNQPSNGSAHSMLADETPVFACSTGKKRASLCMSNDESQLTYRLAHSAVLPRWSIRPTPPAPHSSREACQPNGQTLPFMSFDKGNYRYAVYGTTTTMQGILVEQNGKRIANLNCQEDRLSEMGTAWFQRLYLGLDRDKRPLQLP